MTKARHDIDIHFQSSRDDWETPHDLFNSLDEIFHFDLDVCANEANHKCDKWLGSGSDIEDAFSMAGYMAWRNANTCWMNNPYGRKSTPLWIKEAYRQWLDNNTSTICLIPARTETKCFHQYCWKAEAILFFKGRIKFIADGKTENAAPFPSCLVFFTNKEDSKKLSKDPRTESGKLFTSLGHLVINS